MGLAISCYYCRLCSPFLSSVEQSSHTPTVQDAQRLCPKAPVLSLVSVMTKNLKRIKNFIFSVSFVFSFSKYHLLFEEHRAKKSQSNSCLCNYREFKKKLNCFCLVYFLSYLLDGICLLSTTDQSCQVILRCSKTPVLLLKEN